MARITVEKLGGGIHSNDRRVENFSFKEKEKERKSELGKYQLLVKMNTREIISRVRVTS